MAGRRRPQPIFRPDAEPQNADWLRRRWPATWPPYKSPEFMARLRSRGMTLEQFRTLPVYRYAVAEGRIRDDEWVG